MKKIKVRSTRIEYFKWPTRKILSKIHYVFTIYDWSRIQITHQDIGEIEKSSGMHCIYGFQFAVCKYIRMYHGRVQISTYNIQFSMPSIEKLSLAEFWDE